MVAFNSETLKSWTEGEWNAPLQQSILGFSNDTRQISKGQMFVALRTERRDGHDFLTSAEESGASAALVERFVSGVNLPQLKVKDVLKALQQIAAKYRMEFTGKVVAISGSCGKTSTKDILHLLLGKDRTFKTQKNLNNFLGVPLTLLQADNEKHDFLVVEAGINQVGEMMTLAEMIRGDVVVITNIGDAHLEGLGDRKTIAYEKSRLAEISMPEARAIFPDTCLDFEVFKQLQKIRTVLKSGDKGQTTNETLYYDVALQAVSGEGMQSMDLRLHTSPELSFKIPSVSAGMCQNFALAIAAALELGVQPEEIQDRVLEWKASSNRGEVRIDGDLTYYVDCYNASPLSMRDSIQYFKDKFDHVSARVFVLGSMAELGDSSRELHFELGAFLQPKQKDKVILIGNHSEAVRDGIASTSQGFSDIQIVNNVEEIKEKLKDFSGAVLLKGSRVNKLESILSDNTKETEVAQ